MCALTDNLVLKVVSEIHDPVTTTDELIPSGETSSFRSNPLNWLNLHYQEKTRIMFLLQKKSRKRKKQEKKETAH